jgi:DNA-directed RNA polymerase
MPEVYAAINAVQHTPYRVNAVVLDVVQRLMETRSPIGDLDVYDDGVFPTRPPILDMVCEKTHWLEKLLARAHFFLNLYITLGQLRS